MRSFWKRTGLLLALAFMLSAAGAGPAARTADAQDLLPISVVVNGRALVLDVPPMIENGRTLVPLRALAEAIGYMVDWDGDARRITLSRQTAPGSRILLWVDYPVAVVDDVALLLDVPPRIVNGRTLVPARFVSEQTGARVEWDPATRTVYVTSPAAPPGE